MADIWMAEGGWRMAEGSRGISVAARMRVPVDPNNRLAGDSAIRPLPTAI